MCFTLSLLGQPFCFGEEFLVKTTSPCFHVIVSFYTSIQQCMRSNATAVTIKMNTDRIHNRRVSRYYKILRSQHKTPACIYLFTQNI